MAKIKTLSGRNNQASAVISKLIVDNESAQSLDENGNLDIKNPPMAALQNLSDTVIDLLQEYEVILQLLPDVELGIQILIASILSPNDLRKPDLSFSVSEDFKDEEIITALLPIVKNYFVKVHKINEKLQTIVREALVTKGAHITAIIPESSLDQIINPTSRMSLESFNQIATDDEIKSKTRNLGLLYSPNNISLESGDDKGLLYKPIKPFSNISLENKSLSGFKDFSIEVNDNPEAFKIPLIANARRELFTKAKVDELYGFSMESLNFLKKKKLKEKVGGAKGATVNSDSLKIHGTDKENIAELDAVRDFRAKEFLRIRSPKETGRKNIGHPLILDLPIESTMPAFLPGKPSQHIGYYVITDQYNNILSFNGVVDYYRDMQNSMNSNKDSEMKAMISELRGPGANTNMRTIDMIEEANKTFNDIVTADLLSKLRDSQQSGMLDIPNSGMFLKLMFARALKKLQTKVIYIPAEFVNYIAFDYSDRGVGKSILENSRTIANIRILIMFVNAISTVKNSTSRTVVDIQFDPRDPDPYGTSQKIVSALLRSRSEAFPFTHSNPSIMLDYVHRAGIDVVYGSHPDLPDMKVDVGSRQADKLKVDSDYDRALRIQHMNSLGVNPELTDPETTINFATIAENNSVMLEKRTALHQEVLETGVTDLVRKFTRSSQTLVKEMIEALLELPEFKNTDDENKILSVIENFISSIETYLPRPDSIKIENQMAAFKAYDEAIDVAIAAFINDEMVVTDASGEMADNIVNIRVAVKAYFLRKYMRENNIFPELIDMISTDEDGNPLAKLGEIHAEHMEKILKFVEDYVTKAKEANSKRTKRLEKLEEKFSNGDDDDSSEDSFGDDDDSSEDSFGDDDDSSDTDTEDDSDEEETGSSEDLNSDVDGENEVDVEEIKEGTEEESEEETKEEELDVEEDEPTAVDVEDSVGEETDNEVPETEEEEPIVEEDGVESEEEEPEEPEEEEEDEDESEEDESEEEDKEDEDESDPDDEDENDKKEKK